MNYCGHCLLESIAMSAGKPMALDQSFRDAGLDSLDFLFMIRDVEIACEVEFPPADVAGFKTPADVMAWLEAHA